MQRGKKFKMNGVMKSSKVSRLKSIKIMDLQKIWYLIQLDAIDIEWEKLWLPHVYILICLMEEDISNLPGPTEHRSLYEMAKSLILRGPYSIINIYYLRMKDKMLSDIPVVSCMRYILVNMDIHHTEENLSMADFNKQLEISMTW